MPKYIQGRLLGSGTYAKVYEGVETETNTTVALKKITINGQEGMPSTALREISILKSLSHPNIIKILDVVHKEASLTIVFEYVEYDLLRYIEKHNNVGYLINQLVSGIHHLHTRNIVHRDLKPHNILVSSSGVLKIADFGLARKMKSGDYGYSSEVVTLWYRAPELIAGYTKYGCEIDIWSLGCILYEIVTKKPLLPGENKPMQLSMCNKMSVGMVMSELKMVYKVPEIFVYLICRCLEKSPMKRMTADEIVKYLEKAYG